jgi:hypothetical protein
VDERRLAYHDAGRRVVGERLGEADALSRAAAALAGAAAERRALGSADPALSRDDQAAVEAAAGSISRTETGDVAERLHFRVAAAERAEAILAEPEAWATVERLVAASLGRGSGA